MFNQWDSQKKNKNSEDASNNSSNSPEPQFTIETNVSDSSCTTIPPTPMSTHEPLSKIPKFKVADPDALARILNDDSPTTPAVEEGNHDTHSRSGSTISIDGKLKIEISSSEKDPSSSSKTTFNTDPRPASVISIVDSPYVPIPKKLEFSVLDPTELKKIFEKEPPKGKDKKRFFSS